MGVKSFLFLGETKYKLRGCTYSFNRSTSSLGFPTSHVAGGRIICEMLFPPDYNIFKSMIEEKELNGEILFKDSDSGSTIKRVHFKKAFLIHYQEFLNKDQPQIHFSLAFQESRIGKAHYKILEKEKQVSGEDTRPRQV